MLCEGNAIIGIDSFLAVTPPPMSEVFCPYNKAMECMELLHMR